MWKNKHVLTALLVAPLLAITAGFAVDKMVAEKPHAARAGAAYALAAQSVCRYASGRCVLRNGDFELTVVVSSASSLSLQSSHEISAAVVSHGSDGEVFDTEVQFERDYGAPDSWRGDLGATLSATDTLRIAVSASGATYYAEITMAFIE